MMWVQVVRDLRPVFVRVTDREVAFLDGDGVRELLSGKPDDHLGVGDWYEIGPGDVLVPTVASLAKTGATRRLFDGRLVHEAVAGIGSAGLRLWVDAEGVFA